MTERHFIGTMGLFSAITRNEVILFVGKTNAARDNHIKWIKSASESKYCAFSLIHES